MHQLNEKTVDAGSQEQSEEQQRFAASAIVRKDHVTSDALPLYLREVRIAGKHESPLVLGTT